MLGERKEGVGDVFLSLSLLSLDSLCIISLCQSGVPRGGGKGTRSAPLNRAVVEPSVALYRRAQHAHALRTQRTDTLQLLGRFSPPPPNQQRASGWGIGASL